MPAKSIMIQGTTSSAGKSFLVAGLCRAFARKGLRVAPFKSQNMALNSFVTLDGLEMGRAQVMQAQAAGIEPDVRMNPVLLKPTGDAGSQVVVMGEVVADMSAREYFAYRGGLKPTIRRAYDELAAVNDLILIEGAGSPAEINLKKDDIVNMGLASLVGAPVLIVGDIDRGGVFASLYGTVALLPPHEREYVKGLVINKFRGDPALLGDGPAQLEGMCGAPVVGCVPYIDVDLDDEDSLADHLTGRPREATAPGGALDVAVIRLPRISNWTDLDPLCRFAQVRVRFIERADDLGTPDLLVLPGSKAAINDLRWLKATGLDAAIARAANAGSTVLGICGGYQMLGVSIEDPLGSEGGGCERGLGLLPMRTVFDAQKRRTRVAGRVVGRDELPVALAPLAESTFTGYEIHMGRTEPCRDGDGRRLAVILEHPANCPAHGTASAVSDGCASGAVLGCYVHGLFEDGTLAESLVRLLCDRRGIAPVFPAETHRAYRERQFDLLADTVERSLDMGAVQGIIDEGV